MLEPLPETELVPELEPETLPEPELVPEIEAGSEGRAVCDEVPVSVLDPEPDLLPVTEADREA